MIAMLSYTDFTFELIGLEDDAEENVNTLISDIEMIEMNFDAWRLHAFITAGVPDLIITGVSYNSN